MVKQKTLAVHCLRQLTPQTVFCFRGAGRTVEPPFIEDKEKVVLDFVPPFDLAMKFKGIEKKIPAHSERGLQQQRELVASCRKLLTEVLTVFEGKLTNKSNNSDS